MYAIRICIITLFTLLNIFPVSAQDWSRCLDSANAAAGRREPDKALLYYDSAALLLPRDSLASDTYIAISRGQAVSYMSLQEFSAALEKLGIVKTAVFRLHGLSYPVYLDAVSAMGTAYMRLGQFAGAEACFTEARELAAATYTRHHPKYARGCSNLGNVYAITGEYDRAEALYLESRSILTLLDSAKTTEYAQSCNGLASLYIDKGEYEKAEPFALEARAIRAAVLTVRHPDYALTCITLGNLYKALGKYDKAEALYLEAKQIRADIFKKKAPLYTASCSILADLYFFMGRNREAVALYIEAREILIEDKYRGSPDYATTSNNLATLYLSQGNYREALSLALEAKRIWDTLPSRHPDHAINYNNLGRIYFQLHAYEKALICLVRARHIWERDLGPQHPYFIQNTEDLARVYWRLGRMNKADSLYRESFSARTALLQRIFRFTSESEKHLYLDNNYGSPDEYFSFYYSRHMDGDGGRLYDMALSRRNLILNSSSRLRKLIHEENDSALTRKFDDWIAMKKRMAYLYGEGNFRKTDQIDRLEEQADSVEKVLAKRSAKFKQWTVTKTKWRDIRGRLASNEAAIEFSEFRYYDGRRWTDSVYYVGLLIRKEFPTPRLIFLFEKSRLRPLLDTAGGNPSQTTMAIYDSSAYCTLIWHPMEKYLAGVRKVYFSPAGLLLRISFAALPVDDEHVLGDKYQMVQMNSTAAVMNEQQVRLLPSDKMVLYGGIRYNAPGDVTDPKAFGYLSGTLDEIDRISGIVRPEGVRTSLVTGDSATERSIRLLEHGDVTVLHLATHGFYFPEKIKEQKGSGGDDAGSSAAEALSNAEDPLLRSGVLFAGGNYTWLGKTRDSTEDGILTAYEVANLYMPAVKLAVLSACETASGDVYGDEGVYGLQRSFKMAGVTYLVMSLWPVPGPQTTDFMLAFYSNMAHGLTISDAFYNAQREMRSMYRYAPHRWAAWVLIR